MAVTTGLWYLCDFKTDVSVDPHTMDLMVNGVAGAQTSIAAIPTGFTTAKFGANSTSPTATNYTHYIDDIVLSTTLADYPIGDGKIVGLYANSDGTHNFDTAGDFTYENTTNVPTSATDTWGHVNSQLDTTIGNFIAVNAASNTEYLEWQFQNLGTNVQTINGLQVSMASHASGGAANKQTLRLNDNGTLSDVCTDLDQSQVTICYHTKQYTTAPSTGTTWTKTLVDGLRSKVEF